MKKITSLILALIIVLSVLTLFSGCGKNEPESLAVVLGINSNYPAINLNSPDLYDPICQTVATFNSGINVIVSDSQPFMYSTYTISLDTTIDSQKEKQLSKQYSNQIIDECKNAIPKSDEIDLLEGVFTAADSLVNADGDRKLLIVASGLSTYGLLDFARKPFLINMTPEAIVEKLQSVHAIPSLEGVSVTWVGFAETAGEQEKLSKENEYKLRAIWEAILNAAGAKTIKFVGGEFLGEDTRDMPYVTPVVFESYDPFDKNDFIKLDSIRFVSDSAVFINEEDACAALLPFADYLKSNPQRIILAGMTATVKGSTGEVLSLERANACKRLLVDFFGIDEDLIITLGLGSRSSSFRVNDVDEFGNLIESAAQKNRAVIVCLYNSESGREIMELV